MLHRMDEARWKAFLAEGTRTGKLASVRKDGRPHVVPIWFVLDGDALVFTTAADTIKGKAILRDGRVALCVDDDRPPYAFVSIEGRAAVSDDLDALRRWATEIGRRYMGAERAEEFGARNAVPGELVVRVTPTNVLAVGDVAGYD